nr:MAG TPA: hypothetical protein [Caudoviricetes sp.]
MNERRNSNYHCIGACRGGIRPYRVVVRPEGRACEI